MKPETIVAKTRKLKCKWTLEDIKLIKYDNTIADEIVKQIIMREFEIARYKQRLKKIKKVLADE